MEREINKLIKNSISFLSNIAFLWDKKWDKKSTAKENIKTSNEDKEFINFLKSNLDNTKTTNDIFRIQNLLNQVYSLIQKDIQEKDIELIYNVSPNLPIELVLDNLRLQKILYNLISYIIDIPNCKNIILTIEKEKIDKSIHFEIQYTNNNTKEIQKKLSSSNEERLAISSSLISDINGHFTMDKESLLLSFTLPLLENELYVESYYSIPSNIANKKVLLCDKNTITAEILKKIFLHFSLEVEIHPSDNIVGVKNLNTYDIIVLDTTQLSDMYLRQLRSIKDANALTVISLCNTPSQKRMIHKPNTIVDKYLYKPLSLGAVYTLLYDIYVIQTLDSQENFVQQNDKIHFIKETKNISPDSFQDFNGTHILLAEDNIVNQKIIQSILAKSDIQLFIANNGLEAIEYLEKNHTVDLILTDINMPIMDGYETTEKIREKDVFSSTPIVVISTLNFRDEIEKMYMVGANAHLTKPFKIGELYTAFNMYIQNNIPETKQIIYDDVGILDTQKGMRTMGNILRYRDALGEALFSQKNSSDYIRELIIKKEFDSLYIYCKDKKEDNQSIGAFGLSNILNEIMILAENKEEAILQTYISSYYNEWKNARQYIEFYIKSK